MVIAVYFPVILAGAKTHFYNCTLQCQPAGGKIIALVDGGQLARSNSV